MGMGLSRRTMESARSCPFKKGLCQGLASQPFYSIWLVPRPHLPISSSVTNLRRLPAAPGCWFIVMFLSETVVCGGRWMVFTMFCWIGFWTRRGTRTRELFFLYLWALSVCFPPCTANKMAFCPGSACLKLLPDSSAYPTGWLRRSHCYMSEDFKLSEGLSAHLTRGLATLWALFKGLCICFASLLQWVGPHCTLSSGFIGWTFPLRVWHVWLCCPDLVGFLPGHWM